MITWETVIGLEVHVQLSTHSKIFSGASTAYGAEPNTQASAIDLGLPGTLPVLNQKAVEMAVKFGLAIQAELPAVSIFARKNYFYPDSPKGYQISQHEHPIVKSGHVMIRLEDGQQKTIRITRAHLEEDAGKSIHDLIPGHSGIDLNRAGTALLEIVSEPDMRSATEAVAYLKTLHGLVRALGICDGNMQEGSFRCDVNISIRPTGTETFGTRVECKNINSFRFVERAIAVETERQITLLESGKAVMQETRMYDANCDQTYAMRSKEDAEDYRYFPDPDLLPVQLDAKWIEQVRQQLPELPDAKRQRYQTELQLSAYDAQQLTQDPALSQYFEMVLKHCQQPKLIANWLLGEMSAALNQHQLSMETCPITPEHLAQLIVRIQDNTLSSKTAKIVFAELWEQPGNVDEIIAQKGLQQISDDSVIQAWITEVISAHPQQVEQYRTGQEKVLSFLVGQVMKRSQGKANPTQVTLLIKQLL